MPNDLDAARIINLVYCVGLTVCSKARPKTALRPLREGMQIAAATLCESSRAHMSAESATRVKLCKTLVVWVRA